ncbi:hypothetical protein B0T16DRAFT_330051 [Cercophora newfieldiana]|uniref:Uncharacterized protein n=1 Tax=Cercophora newfieldiana TaxID=92897 RepID=A0AA40CPZ9_9PEZI|nr:hypothetical protein B0T16DRAFT_330051 [Cercophora newfieldiana]
MAPGPSPTTEHMYPGLELPLRHFPQKPRENGQEFYRIAAHPECAGASTPILMVREIGMLIFMDRLTDKPNWDHDVFDETVVAQWRHEAFTQSEDYLRDAILADKKLYPAGMPVPNRQRIISKKAFDYCIAELRSKAALFDRTGLIYTLNSRGNRVVKSDSALRNQQAPEQYQRPGADCRVYELVDPSMYPFVHGRSEHLRNELVGVTGAVELCGKGQVTPRKDRSSPMAAPDPNSDSEGWNDFWSETYQWLPANVSFRRDGTAKFTSYINNLHPDKHPEIYDRIEQLLDACIPAWDHVLNGYTHNETTMGNANDGLWGLFDQIRFPKLKDGSYEGLVYENDKSGIWEKFDDDVVTEHEHDHGEIKLPDWHSQILDEDSPYYDSAEEFVANLRKEKWEAIREAIYPEPQEFKPLLNGLRHKLRDRFKDTGLQVVVKMSSIELTPENPEFAEGEWQVEGQLNEHIVATALFFVDCDNVTTGQLSFRMKTFNTTLLFSCEDSVKYYERVYATTLPDEPDYSAPGGIQNFGNIEIRQGRIIAFPNVFQYRVSGFSLQDRTKPGHRRLVTLCLVDPHQRIISTGNVPPQRADWWAEAIFRNGSNFSIGNMPQELFQVLFEQGATDSLNIPPEALDKIRFANRLPLEIMEMVRQHCAVPPGIMTPTEARQHHGMLLEERARFQKRVTEEWMAEEEV